MKSPGQKAYEEARRLAMQSGFHRHEIAWQDWSALVDSYREKWEQIAAAASSNTYGQVLRGEYEFWVNHGVKSEDADERAAAEVIKVYRRREGLE